MTTIGEQYQLSFEDRNLNKNPFKFTFPKHDKILLDFSLLALLGLRKILEK